MNQLNFSKKILQQFEDPISRVKMKPKNHRHSTFWFHYSNSHLQKHSVNNSSFFGKHYSFLKKGLGLLTDSIAFNSTSIKPQGPLSFSSDIHKLHENYQFLAWNKKYIKLNYYDTFNNSSIQFPPPSSLYKNVSNNTSHPFPHLTSSHSSHIVQLQNQSLPSHPEHIVIAFNFDSIKIFKSITLHFVSQFQHHPYREYFNRFQKRIVEKDLHMDKIHSKKYNDNENRNWKKSKKENINFFGNNDSVATIFALGMKKQSKRCVFANKRFKLKKKNISNFEKYDQIENEKKASKVEKILFYNKKHKNYKRALKNINKRSNNNDRNTKKAINTLNKQKSRHYNLRQSRSFKHSSDSNPHLTPRNNFNCSNTPLENEKLSDSPKPTFHQKHNVEEPEHNNGENTEAFNGFLSGDTYALLNDALDEDGRGGDENLKLKITESILDKKKKVAKNKVFNTDFSAEKVEQLENKEQKNSKYKRSKKNSIHKLESQNVFEDIRYHSLPSEIQIFCETKNIKHHVKHKYNEKQHFESNKAQHKSSSTPNLCLLLSEHLMHGNALHISTQNMNANNGNKTFSQNKINFLEENEKLEEIHQKNYEQSNISETNRDALVDSHNLMQFQNTTWNKEEVSCIGNKVTIVLFFHPLLDWLAVSEVAFNNGE